MINKKFQKFQMIKELFIRLKWGLPKIIQQRIVKHFLNFNVKIYQKSYNKE